MSFLRKLAVVIVLLSPMAANALLINLGDVTRDTRTGLDWLDLTETQGISYDAVLGGAGGYLDDGWKIATGDLIDDLFYRYSLFVPERQDGGPIPDETNLLQHLSSERLVRLLGATLSNNMPGGSVRIDDPLGPTQIAVSGWYDDGTGGLRTGIAGMIVRFEDDFSPQQCQFCVDWNTFDDFFISSQSGVAQGVWLVRSVPEPGTLALLAIGLAAIGITRRRKKA